MTFRAVFAGGGTGGHIFPLLAVAAALRRLRPDADIQFVGAERGLEAHLLPAQGETSHLLPLGPLKGMGLKGALRSVGQAAWAVPRCRGLLRRLQPRFVLTTGGYASGPVGLAAASLRVPLALLEPNRAPGLVTRVLAPLAGRIYTAHADLTHLGPQVVFPYGLPLRAGFAASTYAPKDGRARVVVLGGSQGAEALNRVMPCAVEQVAREVSHVTVVHQTGAGRGCEVRDDYASRGLAAQAEVLEFADDMPALLASADLVISRAGAGAVAEILAVGRAAIYVPYPYAADDHQAKNVLTAARAGACRCLRAEQATAEALAREMTLLLKNPSERFAMASAARSLGNPYAADQVAIDLLQWSESAKTFADPGEPPGPR